MSLVRLLALTVVLLASHAFAEHAPAFDVKNLAGHRYTLSGLSGKLVVLNFWFRDCPACRKERESLNRVVLRYIDNPDVVFLALALDKKEALEPFLNANPLYYDVIPDAGDVAEAYDISAYPTHIIIGRDGNIVRQWTGALSSFRKLTEVIDGQLRRASAQEGPPIASPFPKGSTPVWEPPLLVSPEHPTPGTTVKVYYAPDALEHPEAQLAWDIHGDSSFSQGTAPMHPQGVLLAYELKLPADATLVHLRLLSGADRRTIEHTVPVTNRDGGTVLHAFADAGACDIPGSVERELQHHPDSPFALLARLEERMGTPGSSPEAARKELLEVLKTAHGTGLELLAITVDAMVLARDFKAAAQALDIMMTLDRDAFMTRRELSRLLTQPYGDVSRQWPPELLPRAWKVLAGKDDVWSRRAASRSTAGVLDTEAAEKMCTAWRDAEPSNPFAQDCLARILEKQGRYPEALEASRAALEAATAGKLFLYSGSGSLASREEELWARHAELSLQARNPPELAGALEP